MATGILSPYPLYYAWNITTGDPLAGGLVYTVTAGGSWPGNAVSTFTDVGLTVANANPIVLNSAGYCVIYLTPGVSYKYIVTDSAGVPQYTQDNIKGTSSPAAVDITGTVGENVAAEDVLYLSDGSGSKVAGQWYKADADFSYASSEAGQTGIAQAAITSGSAGTIRTIGQMAYASALTPGSKYYVSATPGALTATAPANQRYVGSADGVNSIVLGPGPIPFPVDNSICDVRLTLTTAVPVTTADVTGATSIFVTPYKGNRMALYDGANWAIYTFAELTQALGTVTSGLPYDVFAYNNAGVVATEILAWTNGTTRATALALQNGVLSKTGALTRRYLGTFYTTSTTATEDSVAKRFLWNYYNRVDRGLLWQEVTASWTYSTATWRQVRATATNKVEFIIGVAEVLVHFDVTHMAANSGASIPVGTAVGLDSITVPMTTMVGGGTTLSAATEAQGFHGTGEAYPVVGYHYAAWLETSAAFATTTWYGLAASITSGAALTGINPGIRGRLPG